MHANYGKTRFESDNSLNLESTTLTHERLEDAYDLLHEHVPGCENLLRVTNIIKRNGLVLKERSNLVDILSSSNDAKMDMKLVINGQQQQQLILKGFDLLVALAYVNDIKVYYFSTRRHAQVINTNGKRTVAILHHIDSFLNQDPIWFELEDMIQYKRDIENALKASTSLEKALTSLHKHHTKHNNRRAVPRIYTDIQNTLIKENPNLEGVNRSWFGDQVKNCPNYNQLNEFKDLGNQLIEEVRGFLESCSWEDVVLSHLDNVASGSKDASKDADKDVDEEDIDDDDDDDVSDDDDDDDEDSNRPKKIQETITFSLRSILRSELDYGEILSSFQKEQERVGRCLSELGKGVGLLTNKIITGDIATLFGETISSSQVDLQALAPEFDFGSNTKTTVAVAPIPSNTTQQKMIYDGIYTFGHFSNILSGCIGNSVREKSYRPTYKDIRNMINRSNTVSAQEDMSFTGGYQ
ncbi:hypothetical protein BDA99DRAFT_492530 [Phascolomyces articulosus]|uniref:Uncharacterized protein n=1 Tax=Phascolomyces articulosus TaxID=60185 RepID=A0AAD5PMI4_9FUNG|nr:hypothetical protein BDA99DRAFT_492530 [Phascolomyces articulosus]